ncbi:hypothetical protein ACHHYP_07625 [Achlya hypogyna]|uniref:Uncharacterized protein n=1 Tax=Achlya hypogyna TaxID=1202772 RepID=A0A1V9ZLP0_ACHHY|nr:hypothetical protein ACHHYP_07625 [Achlya hypogyna]
MSLNSLRTSIVGTHLDSALRLHYKPLSNSAENGFCTCNGRLCQLTPILKHVFIHTDLGHKLALNTRAVVQQRTQQLGAFLHRVQTAFMSCPKSVLSSCETNGCKTTRLIKSFFGTMHFEA